jgi:DNA-binding IclR family transcriptional regulator
VLEGDNVRFVDGVESDQPVRVTVRTGALMPAHSTSGGKVLLAELSPQHLHALYPQGLRRVADRTIVDLRELEEELAAVRREGYAQAALVASLPAARLGPMQTPRLIQQL